MTNTTSADTAALIRSRLAVKQVKVPALSSMTGIPYDALRRRLNGNVDFTISELMAVAKALGVEPSSLIPSTEVAA